MSRERSFYQRYLELARAKKRGRWRFPLWVCFAIFISLCPVVLFLEGMVIFATFTLVESGLLPMLLSLALGAACAIVVLLASAELIYFGLRQAAIDDDSTHCLTCGYNLTGNVSGICPECGSEIAP